MFWTIFFWIFGVGTCTYYACETINAVRLLPYMSCFFAPLFIIPISNALLLLNDSRKTVRGSDASWMVSLQAMAVCVSALLLLVLTPLVLMALIVLVTVPFIVWTQPEFLMVPFYLLVATGPFITSLVLYRRWRKKYKIDGKAPGCGIVTAFAVTLALVLVSLFPSRLTLAAQEAAANPATRPQAMLLLRALGDEKQILNDCYDDYTALPFYFGFLGEALQNRQIREFDDEGSAEDKNIYLQARETFYRMTGRPFNSVARPDRVGNDYYYVGTDDWSWWPYYNQDRDFAADTVGGIVKGLALTQSRLTGWIDGNEGLSHINWRMHFHNAQSRHAELRAQILLPPGAVVGDCSLWIKGVKHQALFTERNAGRVAYVASANNGETPLLVSTAGAGRVLLQSSMGTWGQDAELEVQIISPLSLSDKKLAIIHLPVFSERNFALDRAHDIDIVSASPVISCAGLTVKPTVGNQGGYALTGALTNDKISGAQGTLTVAHDPVVASVATADVYNRGRDIVKSFAQKKANCNQALLVVVDGSSSMAGSIGTICDALAGAQASDASLIWASDRPAMLVSHVPCSSGQWHDALVKMRDSSCLGGQDNAEALVRAIKSADNKAVNVLWVHAAQPFDFGNNQLLPLLQNSKVPVHLYEYQIAPGPNAVIKSLDVTRCLIQLPCVLGLKNDLANAIAAIDGSRPSYQIDWTECAAATGTRPSVHAGELLQLYVADQIAHTEGNNKLVQHAAELGIVTQSTSALVLESSLDYQRYKVETAAKKAGQAKLSVAAAPNGLDHFISAKPEPPMSLLMLMVLLIGAPSLWLIRRQKRCV